MFLFKDRIRTEYEYTFTNGVMDFAQVFNNRKRKALGTMNIRNVEACGMVNSGSFNRYLNTPGVTPQLVFEPGCGLVLFLLCQGQQKSLLIIEPSETMLGLIKKTLDREIPDQLSTMVYLDNAATTRPSEAVIAAMTAAMQEGYFNPSSLYAPGYFVGKEIETFRLQLAKSLSAREVIFTSGGTERITWPSWVCCKTAVKGRVLYSAVEHSAVAEPCQRLKDHFDVATLPVTASGIVDLNAARDLMTPDTVLICVMQVNNEVGAIQPLEDLIRLRDELCPDAPACGRCPGLLHLDTKLSTGIDSYALSAHKFHGPKGVGALALGKGRVNPLILGGKQENGLRAGTENTYGILGMQAAIRTIVLMTTIYAL